MLKTLSTLALAALASTALVGCGEKTPVQTASTHEWRETYLSDGRFEHTGGSMTISADGKVFTWTQTEMDHTFVTEMISCTEEMEGYKWTCSERIHHDGTVEVVEVYLNNKSADLKISYDTGTVSIDGAGHRWNF